MIQYLNNIPDIFFIYINISLICLIVFVNLKKCEQPKIQEEEKKIEESKEIRWYREL